MVTAERPKEIVLSLKLRGGNLELYNARDPEVLAEGPAGTGKTRTALELLNDLCHHYAGLQVLMTRKIQATMALSCIKEFRLHVLHAGDGVHWFGGSKSEPPAFRYPNGSTIIVAGMDNPDKVLSSFYDVIYVNEATDLTEDDWETLTTRLRASDGEHNAKARDGREFVHRRIIADCNPTYASHWLMRRTDTGRTRVIRSKLEDNPVYFDDDGNETEAGAAYIRTLDRLTGIRYERFRLGKRVGVENAIYPMFDRERHIRPLPADVRWKCKIIGVDYGSDHLCAVVVMGIDQWNRRWILEIWAEADHDQGANLTKKIGEVKRRYNTSRGRTDPNQGYLAGRSGFGVARGGSGGAAGPPRLHRIDLMEPLFYDFQGGRVPSFSEELHTAVPAGPYAEPDSPGIFIVEGIDGAEDLAEEWEAYHYIWTETTKGKTKDVYRVNENRAAAVEYANEEYEEGRPDYTGLYLNRDVLTGATA